MSSSVERADLFRNGAVGGVLGLLGLAGRLKRVRLEGCSLRWYVGSFAEAAFGAVAIDSLVVRVAVGA